MTSLAVDPCPKPEPMGCWGVSVDSSLMLELRTDQDLCGQRLVHGLFGLDVTDPGEDTAVEMADARVACLLRGLQDRSRARPSLAVEHDVLLPRQLHPGLA